MEGIIILILALFVDLFLGEFPSPVHPVVWVGKVISLELKIAPHQGQRSQLAYGIGIVVLTIVLFALSTYFLLAYLRALNIIAYVLVAAFLLSSTFSVRELYKVALRVKGSLEEDNLSEARKEIRALVSRETNQLDEPLLVSATVESMAENSSDSFVSPLFYFLLLGVPGAMAYRVVNTFDAMIGYHGEYEYLGKFAARLDDVLNFIPARISGLLIVVAAYLRRGNGNGAWHTMLRDHSKTESPNAGWPMSAAAGALRVQLIKKGAYRLGDANNPLSPQLIVPTIYLVGTAILLWAGFSLFVTFTLFS